MDVHGNKSIHQTCSNWILNINFLFVRKMNRFGKEVAEKHWNKICSLFFSFNPVISIKVCATVLRESV